MRKYLLPEKANFYKSNLHCPTTISDGKVHVKCSPADRVICTYKKRGVGAKFAEHGEMVTEVAFDANSDLGYFRITVRDEKGNVACTNAYFPEDYL